MSAGWSILIVVFGGLAAITWAVVAGSARIERMRREWERGQR